MSRRPTFDRVAFLSDPHAPYHDEPAFHAALAFLRYFKPAIIYLLGDWIDFYQLSRFDKRPDRVLQLQADLDGTGKLLRETRKSAPRATIRYIAGNHERRLKRFLWTKSAELAGLRVLELPVLLDLAKHDIAYVPSGVEMFRGFVVKHGSIVRLRSGYTATGELERAGLSGCSGHTHRLGQVFKRNYRGPFTWMETGCLCELDPGKREEGYGEGALFDWQHGLGYGFFEQGGNAFSVSPLPIVKGRVRYGGVEISG